MLMPRDKEFSAKLIKLALPMALQQLLMTSLFIFDTIFVGGLGDAYLAAVGQAGNITMLMWCGYYAVSGASAIFAAQYWGKDKDIVGVRKAFTASLLFGGIVAIVFFSLAFFFRDYAMMILSPNENVRAIGSTYLSIVCFAYPVWAVSSMFASILRSIGNTRLPMITSVISVGINIILDSLFVTGNFGFPRWGVRAAAASTVIGSVIELILLITVSRKQRLPFSMHRRDFVKPEKALARQFVRAVIPMAAKDQLWAAGVTVYSISFASLGEAASAAFCTYNTLGEFMNVFFIGVAGAGGIIIGHVLGAGEIDKAKAYASRLLRIVFLAGLLLCPIFLLLRDVMVLPFPNLSDEAISYTKEALLMMSFIIWAKSINFTNMNGILRSGGDTLGAAAIDVGMLWLIGVPLTVVAGMVLGLPFWQVFAMTCLEEIAKTVVGILRVRKYTWAKTLV